MILLSCFGKNGSKLKSDLKMRVDERPGIAGVSYGMWGELLEKALSHLSHTIIRMGESTDTQFLTGR